MNKVLSMYAVVVLVIMQYMAAVQVGTVRLYARKGSRLSMYSKKPSVWFTTPRWKSKYKVVYVDIPATMIIGMEREVEGAYHLVDNAMRYAKRMYKEVHICREVC